MVGEDIWVVVFSFWWGYFDVGEHIWVVVLNLW